jgi:hypothetical protein
MKMTRRMPRVAAAVLAALLVAGPAHAAGWLAPLAPPAAFERAWQWLEGLWPAAPHTAAVPAPQTLSRTEKSGAGTSSTPTSSDTVTTCQVNCERGGGIDPDG